MDYNNIFELTNNLIDMLAFCDNDNLVNYIINELSSNGYASEEGYKEYLADKHDYLEN